MRVGLPACRNRLLGAEVICTQSAAPSGWNREGWPFSPIAAERCGAADEEQARSGAEGEQLSPVAHPRE